MNIIDFKNHYSNEEDENLLEDVGLDVLMIKLVCEGIIAGTPGADIHTGPNIVGRGNRIIQTHDPIYNAFGLDKWNEFLASVTGEGNNTWAIMRVYVATRLYADSGVSYVESQAHYVSLTRIVENRPPEYVIQEGAEVDSSVYWGISGGEKGSCYYMFSHDMLQELLFTQNGLRRLKSLLATPYDQTDVRIVLNHTDQMRDPLLLFTDQPEDAYDPGQQPEPYIFMPKIQLRPTRHLLNGTESDAELSKKLPGSRITSFNSRNNNMHTFQIIRDIHNRNNRQIQRITTTNE